MASERTVLEPAAGYPVYRASAAPFTDANPGTKDYQTTRLSRRNRRHTPEEATFVEPIEQEIWRCARAFFPTSYLFQGAGLSTASPRGLTLIRH